MSIHLKADDFQDYFRALNNKLEPFPWQLRLARNICEYLDDPHHDDKAAKHAFPSIFSLPTGTGKTSLLDIALFALAYDLANRSRRIIPLRIAWVVDRRLIVDDVYDRASNIKEELENALGGVLGNVASLFRRVAGPGAPPLVVQALRGGMPLEGDWARTPSQPTVLSSTVDQVGSRLMFRGYGVSPRMRPIHAGLLGEDALIILDEVHLAEPLRQTLNSVGKHKRISHMPWQTVTLSATPREQGEAFTLDPKCDYADKNLRRRIFRPKLASLRSLGRIEPGGPKLVESFVDEALRITDFTGGAGPKITLVVVNRVKLARDIYEGLLKKLPLQATDCLTLLVGRNRGVSKDRLSKEVLARCKSRPDDGPETERRPFIIVATQCIEAGADIDADALVTQIAPLDALRQRFGRLNRVGRNESASAVIVAVGAETSATAKADPLYELAARDTWRWLEARVDAEGRIDFSAANMDPDQGTCRQLSGPIDNAPIFMPAHVRALSRTLPEPSYSPDVALYLRGPGAVSPAEVNVIWRADLPDAGATEDSWKASRAIVGQLLSIFPPRITEAVSIPIGFARRWLRRDGGYGAISDMDDTNDLSDSDSDTRLSRSAWIWRGPSEELHSPDGIRPGDTLVVRAAEGGCDPFGWRPDYAEAVVDVADEGARPYRNRSFAVRLHKALYGQAKAPDEMPSPWANIAETLQDLLAERNGHSASQLVSKLAAGVDGTTLPRQWRDAIDDLAKMSARSISLYRYVSDGDSDDSIGDGLLLYAKRGRAEPGCAADYDSATEDDSLGLAGRLEGGESLESHSENTRRQAEQFVQTLDIEPSLAKDITLAAFLHDIGKADRRFQRYLVGSPWDDGVIRAKSGGIRSRREDRDSLAASGLPRKWRHEALSVVLARAHPDFVNATDPELVLWLIGTHHGFGRPSFPHEETIDGTTPGPEQLDFAISIMTSEGELDVDWPSMFLRLEERYGSWGLAWIESVVRLADHRASEHAPSLAVEASS